MAKYPHVFIDFAIDNRWFFGISEPTINHTPQNLPKAYQPVSGPRFSPRWDWHLHLLLTWHPCCIADTPKHDYPGPQPRDLESRFGWWENLAMGVSKQPWFKVNGEFRWMILRHLHDKLSLSSKHPLRIGLKFKLGALQNPSDFLLGPSANWST